MNKYNKIFLLLIFGCFIISLGFCSENVNLHQHSFNEKWTSDSQCHWHSATCEHLSEIIDKSKHTWDQGTETKPATETENWEDVMFTLAK